MTLQSIGVSLRLSETVGRFVVDFGFASLLDKFQEHYGRLATKLLVGLIGVAVVAVCLGLIWQFLYPIIEWTNNTAAGHSLWSMAFRFAGFLSALAVLIAGGAAVAAAIDAKQMVRASEDLIGQAVLTFEAATNALVEAKGLIDDINNGATVTDVDPKRTGKLITDAQDSLQRLRDVESRMKMPPETRRGKKSDTKP